MNDRREREGLLVGVGAAITLIVLIALQSFLGSGLLSTRTVTSTTTAAASTIPDAYQQVASQYTNHLLHLDSRNVSALLSDYESNATVEWRGAIIGQTGNYTGSSNIDILLRSTFAGKLDSLYLSNERQTIGPKGGYWIVNSTFDFRGHNPIVGVTNGTIVAQDFMSTRAIRHG